jgi:hypothetical protein
MNRLKSSKSIKRNAQLLKGVHLILILEHQPEESREIQELGRVIKKQLLIPVRVFSPFSHHTHHPVELVWLCILI